MATPQQQPQQPIYPHDLSIALDRNFNKFTSYTSSRFEELAAQMRIADDEALIRDNDLANAVLRLAERLSNVETRLASVETRLTNVETTQQTILNILVTMQEQIKDGFAAQAERLNELMMRVDKLEGRGQN